MTCVDLTTIETFEITGRGVMHVVDVTELNKTRDPRSLTGHVIRLNGELRRVRGVETPCVPWRPGHAAFNKVALRIS